MGLPPEAVARLTPPARGTVSSLVWNEPPKEARGPSGPGSVLV